MSRTSRQLYLGRHDFLKTAWNEFQPLYAVLSTTEQWDLHAFFQPAEDLSDEQLLAHRATITNDQPLLPANATRAFFKMHDTYCAVIEGLDQQHEVSAPVTRPRGERRVRVRTVARPEPDVPRLGMVIIEMAEEMVRNQEGNK